MIVRPACVSALCPLMFILFLCLPAAAGSWHVNPAGTGDVPTIQAAVNAAADGDEILLADGTFTGVDNRRVDLLGKRLVIRSESGDANACIIDGEDVLGSGFRIVSGEGPETQLADLTLTRMAHESDHSAVHLDDSAPTLRNLRITASEYGLRSFGGAPSLEDVVVQDCSIPALRFHRGAATLTGCVLEANLRASSTGAIVAYETDLALTGCAIRNCGHTYGGSGAGLEIEDCVTTIRDTEISANFSIGIRADQGTLILENCSIEDHRGIGLQFDGSRFSTDELVVRDCTIRNNGWRGISTNEVASLAVDNVVLEGHESGLVVYGYSGQVATVRNCDVRSNYAVGMRIDRYQATVDQCTVTGNGGTGNIHSNIGMDLSRCPTVEVRDCLVVGNAGRGLRLCYCPSALVERITIAGNGGESTGGGLLVEGGNSHGTLQNTIVWGNCSDDDTDIEVRVGASLELSCVNVDTGRIGGAGTVLVTGTVLESDPLFCDPRSCTLAPVVGGNYRLAEDSPALHQPCGPMGSEEGGCAISLTPLSWSVIKALYR
jgi:hypothetical protein